MADSFGNHSPGLDSPAGIIAAVTKADADLPAPGVTRALLVGTAGTANLKDAAGNTLANVPLQQGYNPLRVMQVRTGGTASDIWALY
jgi:hypothetical protein